MVRYVTLNHTDFVTKKANEIAEEYYANMDKRVETLWTEGLKEASVSPINKEKFMQETYLKEVVEEFFSDDKGQFLAESNNDNLEFLRAMFSSEIVDSKEISSFNYKDQANSTEQLFLQPNVVPGSNALL